MDANELRLLLQPPTMAVADAGRVLGLSRGSAYEAVHRGDIPSIKVGKRLLVPTAPIRRMLGLHEAA